MAELRSKGEDFFNIGNIFFKEGTVWSSAQGGSNVMECCVNKGVNEGGVVTRGCDPNLSDSWRGTWDWNFILLVASLSDDDIGMLGGIVRECFLFLWADMNDGCGRGGANRGLSLVSASSRHGGLYGASHTQGSSNLLNHKGVVRLGWQRWGLF